MKTLYVFGNEYLAEDNFSHDVVQYLDAKIVLCTSPETVLESTGAIIILDVVKNITEPVLLKPEQLRTRNMLSLHDFDVGFFLNLMKELGAEQTVKIIGIPQQGNAQLIANKVKTWL